MAFNLENLDVQEISGVDDGANPEAHIVLFKHKGTEPMDIKEIEKKLETVEKANQALTAENADLKKQLSEKTEDVQKSVSAVEKKLSDATAEIAKRDDVIKAKDADIAKLNGDKADLQLAQEVEKKFPNSAGTTEEKVAKLKVIRAIPDENVRKSMEADLDKVEKQATEFSKAAGKDDDGKGAKTEAGELDTMAKNYVSAQAKEGKTVSFAKAMSEVMKTPEGKKLYAAANAATVKE